VLACAASVLDQRDVDMELIVVDNGSSDDSVAALRAEHPTARVLEMGENLGFAEGCNRGMAATRSPWVMMLNSDAALERGTLACLLDEARRAPPEVAALQPTLVFKREPARINSTGVQLHSDGTAHDRSFGELVDEYTDPIDVFGTTAGAALYRRSALEQVALPSGILDRGFFMYMEDVDLAWRLRLAGFSARYIPRARVRHRFQGSSRLWGNDFVGRLCRENRIRMLVKNASPDMFARALPRTASDLMRIYRSDGAKGLLRAALACRAAFAERHLVAALSRIERRTLEKRWFTREPRYTGWVPQEEPAPAEPRAETWRASGARAQSVRG
jgi:GT2 family glycosyltransferase